MARRYCGRVGAAFDIPDGVKCPECGSSMHTPIETCGRFVSCHILPSGHACGDDDDHDGHPCLLEPGHDGPHNWRGKEGGDG